MQCQITGQGPLLLLVHGWAMQSMVWADLREELASDFQVITADLRGHGASCDSPGPYTYDAFADDIIDLVRSLAPMPVAAVGWSMGAAVLLKSIERAPGLFCRLAIISGSPCLVSRPGYPCGLPEVTVQRLYRQVERAYPEGLQNFYRLLLTEQERASFGHDPRYVAMTDPGLAPAKDAALASLACLMREDLRGALDRVASPALILHGSRDGIFPAAAAELMHERIAGSRLVMLEQAGHVPFLTRRDDVLRQLRAFLESQA